MAIGVLGNIIFSASSRQINTFDNMRWNNSARYASHDRHLRGTLLEFMGTSAGDITLDMYFSAYLNVNPNTEIAKLLNAQRSGTAMRLVVGNRVRGRHKWVITDLSKGLERHDGRGNLLVASVSVTLREYLRRVS